MGECAHATLEGIKSVSDSDTGKQTVPLSYCLMKEAYFYIFFGFSGQWEGHWVQMSLPSNTMFQSHFKYLAKLKMKEKNTMENNMQPNDKIIPSSTPPLTALCLAAGLLQEQYYMFHLLTRTEYYMI